MFNKPILFFRVKVLGEIQHSFWKDNIQRLDMSVFNILLSLVAANQWHELFEI